MNAPIAFLSGNWVRAAPLTIPIFDAGFVLGATVTEQLRTFGGRLFRLEDHLRRLLRSLQIAQIDSGYSADQLAAVAERVVRENHPRLEPGDDLGLGMFVTPGAYPTLAEGLETGPIVCVHSYPLPFGLWAEKYGSGDRLLVSDVVQVPSSSWPAELKCRSRMHYYLADRRARAVDPQARAVLLDQQGCLSECSTANVVLFRENEGLLSPPGEKILPGISLTMLGELARSLGIPVVKRDIPSEELVAADELLLTSTSVCVLPVVRCNNRPVGNGQAGPVFKKLLAAWSASVGVDIAQQARQFASRRSV